MPLAREDLIEGYYDHKALVEGITAPTRTKSNVQPDRPVEMGDFSWSKVRYETLGQAIGSVRHDSEIEAVGYDLENLIKDGRARKLERGDAGQTLLTEEKDLLNYWGDEGAVYKLEMGDDLVAYHLRGVDPKNTNRKFDVLVTYDAERSKISNSTIGPLSEGEKSKKSLFQIRSYAVYYEDGSDGFYNLCEFVAGERDIIIQANPKKSSRRISDRIIMQSGDLQINSDLRTIEGLYGFMHEVGHVDRMTLQDAATLERYKKARRLHNNVTLFNTQTPEQIRMLEKIYEISLHDSLMITRADEIYATNFGVNRILLISRGIGLSSDEITRLRIEAEECLSSYDTPDNPLTLLYEGTRCSERALRLGHVSELIEHRKNIEQMYNLARQLELQEEGLVNIPTDNEGLMTLRISGGYFEVDIREGDAETYQWFSLLTYMATRTERGGRVESALPYMNLRVVYDRKKKPDEPILTELEIVLEEEAKILAILEKAIASSGGH